MRKRESLIEVFVQCGCPYCFLIWVRTNLYHLSSCGVSLSLKARDMYLQQVEKGKHINRTKCQSPSSIPSTFTFHANYLLSLLTLTLNICFLLSFLSCLFLLWIYTILFASFYGLPSESLFLLRESPVLCACLQHWHFHTALF